VTEFGTELMPSAPQLADGGGRSVQVIGRLRPGVSLSQAQVDLSRVADLITATSRDRGNRTVTIYEGRAVAPGLRSQTMAFMAVVLSLTVLVLGATAINLAALQLARGTARRHEIEVRRALGAGRGRLIRQLLTENLLLSTVACVSALAFVFGGAQVLALWSATTPSGITLTVQPVIAWPVIVFAIVLSLATTVFIGLFPAMKSTRSATSTLAAARASTPGHVRRRPVLTAAQTAGSTLLIVLAAVLLRSLGEAQSIDRGFSTDRIVSGSLDLALRRDTTEQRAEFYSSVIDAAVTTPGVVSAALVEILPLTASSRNRNLLTEGQEAPAGADLSGIRVSTNNVSPGYFGVIGIPLVAGRDFSPRDGHDAPDVAIVNETLARRFWANENPLGRRFRTWDGQRTFSGWIEVIGVARDSKYSTMGEAPRAFFYRPLPQVSTSRVNLLANTVSANPLTVLPALRARLEQLDETVPLFAVDTLERQTGLTLLPVQVTALLAAVLGVVALALTGIGIYGVTSQLVRQRTREAAIRIALGAEPQQVVRAFVRRGLTWALVGLAFGLAGAGAAARLLGSLLYGMNGVDPIAFATATALVATIAYLACWLPARRIVRADPAVTLRAE
jgi:predicted permease